MTAKVKICGLSTPETMEAAIKAGADFVGLVFFAKSPRNVALRQAVKLADQARGRALVVALVVDADDAALRSIASEVQPDFFQAHGSETPERIGAIKSLTGIPVIKALKVREASHVEKARDFTQAAFMLYDAMPPEGAALPGGNGLAFEWSILGGAKAPFMLAGGLTPENVSEALAKTRAAMVDVSSGVESSPGVKDAGLVAKFIEAAKSDR